MYFHIRSLRLMALLVRLEDNLTRGNKAASITRQRFHADSVRGTMLLKVRKPRALITAIQTLVRLLTDVDTLVHDQISWPRTRVRALIAREHLTAGLVVRTLIFELLILDGDIGFLGRFDGCRGLFWVSVEAIFDEHEFFIPRMDLFVVVQLLEFPAREFALFAREELVVVVDGLVVFKVFGVLCGEGALVATVGLAVAGHGDGECGGRARRGAGAACEAGALGRALGLAALVVPLQEADVREDSIAEAAGIPVDCNFFF